MTRNPRHRYVPERQPAPAPQKTHEQLEREAAVAYLAEQRALIPTRQAQGGDPYTYMPTTIGNVMGNYLTIGALDANELRWWANEYYRLLWVAEGMGDAAGKADALRMIGIATDELGRRSETYDPPAKPGTAPSTVPPADRPLGR